MDEDWRNEALSWNCNEWECNHYVIYWTKINWNSQLPFNKKNQWQTPMKRAPRWFQSPKVQSTNKFVFKIITLKPSPSLRRRWQRAIVKPQPVHLATIRLLGVKILQPMRFPCKIDHIYIRIAHYICYKSIFVFLNRMLEASLQCHRVSFFQYSGLKGVKNVWALTHVGINTRSSAGDKRGPVWSSCILVGKWWGDRCHIN